MATKRIYLRKIKKLILITKINIMTKKEEAIQLAELVHSCTEIILDATKEGVSPTPFIRNALLSLRKLDYFSENKFSKIDSIIYGHSEEETDLFVKESIRLFEQYKKHVEQIKGSVKILTSEPIGIFIDSEVINEYFKNNKNGSK